MMKFLQDFSLLIEELFLYLRSQFNLKNYDD